MLFNFVIYWQKLTTEIHHRNGAQGKDSGPAQGGGQPATSSQPSAASSAGVWTSHQASDGTTYYHNSVTKQSSWTKPAAVATAAEASAANTAPPVPVFSDTIEGTTWLQVGECAFKIKN